MKVLNETNNMRNRKNNISFDNDKIQAATWRYFNRDLSTNLPQTRNIKNNIFLLILCRYGKIE